MGSADVPGPTPRRPLQQDGDPGRYEPEAHGPPVDGRVETALRAAQQYYLQRSTMGAIAKELGTSRSTVSRLLSYARDAGLVEIHIHRPQPRANVVERRLRESFDVRAHVARVPSTATNVERLELTAIQAARVINSVFDSDMVIGLSWGTMVNAISRRLIPKPVHNCQFVQLNGVGNSRATGTHYSHQMFSAFGSAFDAVVQQLPAPLFFDSAATKRALFRERVVRRVTELQQAADAALFSVGTVADGTPSSPYLAGYFLDDSDFVSLAEDEAVGDIATVFLRADGSHHGVRLNERTSGPDLDRLREVDHRICAVSGDHKIGALRAALAGGYITHLVIDERTAALLLGTLDAPPA
ncbi:MarR family transcriptional regulator [Streptomyces sp. AJS327]|uniref:sugar-binding transcriptional regulator n=1 Tax=Streptomyces sp. AJS327 TaxID=2545265 RepID=UPI0015DFA2EB|nr:sugar-binding domain-containing protein [Streptomyces sp. AJS327]MBA0050960.1 MarR family transcriptional regulator [Streptomyces sp. AJS327]